MKTNGFKMTVGNRHYMFGRSYMKRKWQHIHLMGVAGIGMSGLAHLMREQGIKVSGCDIAPNNLTNKLSRLGIKIYPEHNVSHLTDDISAVVYSSAIKINHSELREAEKKGIPIYKRAEMQSVLTKEKRTIAVTGTHGKTTVATMITHILHTAGKQPSFMVGAEVPQLGNNASWAEGECFVAETDESDGSQVCVHPELAVITNLDCDHLEYYASPQKLKEQMAKFIANVPKQGTLVVWGEDLMVQEILSASKRSHICYGFSSSLDVYAGNIELGQCSSSFDLWCQGKFRERIEINLPGRHNILNALAAITVALRVGIAVKTVKDAVNRFPGIKRRLEIIWQDDNVTIVDDYAHHPTEIAAVISTVREFVPGRLLGVFQPHRFTRTKYLYRELAASLEGLDDLVLADIYGANEDPLEGVSSQLIYDKLIADDKTSCTYIHSLFDIEEYLISNSQPEDTILFIGAGDITETAHRFAARIKNVYRYNESLAKHTTMKIGGRAKIWTEPKSVNELKKIIREVTNYQVIGNGSNLLVADGDINCCVINLIHFNSLSIDNNILIAGSGVNISKLIDYCANQGLSGLEFLTGIPGTVGGAVKTNAGAWGCQTADVLDSIEVINGEGEVEILDRKQLQFGYRRSSLSKDVVVLSARFRLQPCVVAEIKEKVSEYKFQRQSRIPDYPSAGSVFKNPVVEPSGKIIDRLGLKGARRGNAEISQQHGNIIVNRGGATACDVWSLIEYVQTEVLRKTGIALELELECWGRLKNNKQEAVSAK